MPGDVGAPRPHLAVPWSPSARVRDGAAHHYDKRDRDVVRDTARAAVPTAGAAIRAPRGALGRPTP